MNGQVILCCSCGTAVPPNPSGMCIGCITSQTDISEGIPKQAILQFCRTCERYLQPPAQWLNAELESKELLSLCIRKLRGLNKVRLIDACFQWTEPHSKRIKLKVTIQKEVYAKTVLEQWFVVEYIVNGQQCPDCARVMADQTWRAVVQLRQKVSHKRTFLYLEQLILKHELHKDTVQIKEQKEGIDFFFGQRTHAIRFAEAIRSLVPVRTKTSEQLISHDEQNSTANMRYSYAVEIAPISKDDLVCLSSKQQRLGLRGPLLLCTKVRTLVQLLDPETLQTIDVSSQQYFRDPLETVAALSGNSASIYSGMKEFYVIDIEPTGLETDKFSQVLVTVKRDTIDSEEFTVRSHLGRVLRIGDIVRGYDICKTNVNSDILDSWKLKNELPDIVLVSKVFKRTRKSRNWHLQKLQMEQDKMIDAQEEAILKRREQEYERFLRDLEEDPELRKNIKMYKNSMDVDEDSVDDDAPQVPIEELLESFHIE